MTGREITATLTAAAAVATALGSVAIESKDLSICEANYNELMAAFTRVVVPLAGGEVSNPADSRPGE